MFAKFAKGKGCSCRAIFKEGVLLGRMLDKGCLRKGCSVDKYIRKIFGMFVKGVFLSK